MAALLAPAAAGAAPITVTSAEDVSATECTLRDAIEAAGTNAASGGCAAGQAAPALDTIEFSLAPGAQIGLESPLPELQGPLRIAGPGAEDLLINGRDEHQVFKLQSGQTATISGLKIRGGFCEEDGTCEGGAVYNAGTLTLVEVTLQESFIRATGAGAQVARGGAIFNSGDLTLVESVVSGGLAQAFGGSSNLAAGGGIFNVGSLTLDRSTVETSATLAEGPMSSSFGGGIDSEGTMTIVASSVKNNENTAESSVDAPFAAGGGVRSAAGAGLLTRIERSTVALNSVQSLPAQPGGTAIGGGISVAGLGAFELTSSTVGANFGLGGANLDLAAPAATVRDTIVASSSGGPNCSTPLPSAGFNLDDGTSCGLNQPSDLSSVDPKLEPLADYGGPTQTLALSEGSAAIDRGLAGAGEVVDQRGLPRRSDFLEFANPAVGDGSDIGAFEVQGGLLPGESLPRPAPPVPPPPPPVADTSAPQLRLRGGPKGKTFDRTPTFRFGSEPGARFRCKVDNGRLLACRSPFTTKRLSFGAHRVGLRALDAAGNQSASVVRRFEVLRRPR